MRRHASTIAPSLSPYSLFCCFIVVWLPDSGVRVDLGSCSSAPQRQAAPEEVAAADCAGRQESFPSGGPEAGQGGSSGGSSCWAGMEEDPGGEEEEKSKEETKAEASSHPVLPSGWAAADQGMPCAAPE